MRKKQYAPWEGESPVKIKHHLLLLFPVAVALVVLARKNFLLFHAVVEFASMAVFLFVVFLGFFATRLVRSPFLYCVSITYFFLTIITMLHTLAYLGMGVFPSWGTNEPTQFWILGRYLHSIGILAAVLFSQRKNFPALLTLLLFFFTTGGIVLIVTGLFPDCFHAGTGLTFFKIGSEYLTAALFALSGYFVIERPLTRKKEINYAFARSLLCFIVVAFVFTTYFHTDGFSSVTGHLFYFLGAYILLTGFVLPYTQELLDAHFFALNDKIRRLNRNLEDRVRRRTKELEELTAQLEEDVARRKVVEEGLISAKAETETALRARSEFLAVMSHEVRTPLSGILGMAEYLSEKDLSPSEMKKYISLIKTSGESLLEILNNILDLSKFEAGRQVLDITPFFPLKIAESVITLFSCRADNKDIRVTFSGDADLPPVLLGDSFRLRQVLFNLVGNGVKFTDRGVVSLEMKLSGRDGEKVLVTFSVRDTGIGIADDAREKLFHPFTQSNGTITRRFGGTGLGLAISRRLVEFMGGTLDFDSRPGEGTVFFFTLAFAPGRDEDKPAEQLEDEALPEELSILLAEDNSINRMIFENFLRRDGWAVVTAENGAEAIERSKEGDFDIYILDIEMPDVDGYEAARTIRQIEKELKKRSPIIALTAHSTEDFRIEAEKAGMDLYLTKPVKKSDLLKAIARAVGSGPAKASDNSLTG